MNNVEVIQRKNHRLVLNSTGSARLNALRQAGAGA